jgi:hypothetical protein
MAKARNAVGCALAIAFAAIGRSAQCGESALEYAFRLPTTGAILAPVAVGPSLSGDGALLWVLSANSNLYAVAERGAVIGAYAYEGKASPIVAASPFGQGFLVLDRRMLVAVSPAGTEWFRARLGSDALAEPGFGPDGRVYLALDGALACLSPSGRTLWRADVDSPRPIAPASDGVGPYLAVGGASGPAVVAFDRYGAIRWRASLPAEARAILPIRSPSGDALLLAACANGELACLDGSGLPYASARLQSPPAALAYSPESGLIGAVLDSGEVVACSLASGRLEVAWDRAAPLSGRGARIVATEDRFIATSLGAAISIDYRGTVWRTATIRGSVVPARVAPSGLVCSAGADWVMAAYFFERPGLWRLDPASPSHTPDYRGALEPAYSKDPRFSSDDYRKARLRSIVERIGKGELGDMERADAAFCVAVALDDPGGAWAGGDFAARSSPTTRALACDALGATGLTEYREVLLKVVREDRDPLVRASAASALGRIGYDADGEASRLFLWRLKTRERATDDREASSWVDAVMGFYRFSGGLGDGSGLELLIEVATSSAWPVAQARALEALDSLPEALVR